MQRIASSLSPVSAIRSLSPRFSSSGFASYNPTSSSASDQSHHPEFFDKPLEEIKEDGKDTLERYANEKRAADIKEIEFDNLSKPEDDLRNVQDNPVGAIPNKKYPWQSKEAKEQWHKVLDENKPHEERQPDLE